MLALPGAGATTIAPIAIVMLALADIVLVAGAASWIIRASVSSPLGRVSDDVLRIAEGDYHHRVGDPHRAELEVIQDSVNRLADRLIADQHRLRDNVRSLEETNRQLILARDQVVRTARLASVGTLAAGIAHEVGNPLGAIIGFVDVARRRVEREGGDTELLESIRAEAGRIDRIVRGLLDYARPVSGGDRPAEATSVLFDVRELLDNQGKLDGIEQEWPEAPLEGLIVQEPGRLQQVLVNLLLNAEHALGGRPGARIGVSVQEEEGDIVRMPVRRENDPPGVNYLHRRRADSDEGDLVSNAERVIAIRVADNGPGIAPEIAEHLFDPFFTTKEPGEGTGLGLAICAQLVDGMGGRIDLDEGIDGGAGFVIRLPIAGDSDDLESHSPRLPGERVAS
ncbi:MAG: ATP-binding protein [Gemmatimonadota bacterium]